jgi:type I restriction enzyme S subunit
MVENIPEYFNYLLREFDIKHMKSLGQGIRQTISYTHLKDEYLITPPLSEQQQIVSFLDTKTSLIDSLIEKTQRKIELLKEKRTSLINEVVTKGLNPNVEMKDSGVEWIGEIPSHWELKQLKHIIKTLNSGTSVNSEDTPVTNLDEYGVLKTSCVFGDTFRPNENKKVVIEEYDRVKCPVLKDSIIFSRMNTPDLVGSNGYVDTDYDNLFLPDRLWITEFIEDIKLSVKWLSFVTISRRFRSELSSRSTGTSPSMKNITKDDLLTIKIPYPSFLEQQQIVEYLDEQTQLIDNTISIEEKRIELLKEYRQSLISEVVTGKRKVV